MLRWFQKIVLLVAVVTVTGHSILPHFHHDEIQATINQHHDDEEQPAGRHHHDDDDTKDNQHSLFSFAQLDEDFVPANGQTKTFELSVEYLAALAVSYLSDRFPVHTKTHFGWYQEYPPPDNYYHISSLRGPPVA